MRHWRLKIGLAGILFLAAGLVYSLEPRDLPGGETFADGSRDGQGELLALSEAAATGAGPSALNPDSYPQIGDEEMGQLRWALKIANQPLDDYSNLEAIDQNGMTSYRYAFAFATYFLAAEQYHKLPAWSEAIQPALDRMIQKVIRKPVWKYWAKISQGVFTLEPRMNSPYPESHDPVGHMNIMYSGHVGHMIGLYEMLYRDFKWDQPGAITFVWSDTEKYVYDNHSLNQVMFRQMRDNPYHAICCEPNAVFPECNQHPVLSFMLYDQAHGTNLAAVREQFFDFFLAKKMIDPLTHETAMLYLVQQNLVVAASTPRFHNGVDLVIAPAVSLGIVTLESSSANGWTGSFMHAWQPEYIERHYPYQRDHHLRELGEDEAALNFDYWEPNLKYGFFALEAAEMGDAKTRDLILRHADKKYSPRWEDGAFRYPYNLARKCTNLTGQLLALARALPPRGLWTLHNRPFAEAHFRAPFVSKVDFPRLTLRRAIYDPARLALIVTTAPGTDKRGASSFLIQGLDPTKSYALSLDGKTIRRIQSEVQLEVTVPLEGRHNVVLTEG